MISNFRIVAQGRFDADHRVGPSNWPWFDILYIQTGEVTIAFLDEPTQTMTAGQGVMIYPHTPFVGHAITETSDAVGTHFEMLVKRKRDLPPPVQWLAGQRRGYRMYAPGALPSLDRDLMRALLVWREPRSPERDSMLDALLVLMLGEMGRPAPQPVVRDGVAQPQFTSLLDWIGKHLAEDVTLAKMARRVDLSASHFRARFRKEMGVSPGRFFLSMRAREAQRRLRETNDPIKRIAGDVGYAELAHFYRAFRRLCGETPSRYRARHRLRG
jgi:AraC-like DNA-binding protein